MRFLVIEIFGCAVWRPESTMRWKNLEVDGSTTQNILKPPTSPCFTHLRRLYQGVSLLWSHPWTQPRIWQRWSTLAIFGIGAVQGDFSWFDGVQWCSFFQKINVINMEPIKMGSEEYVRGRHDLVSCTMIPRFFWFLGIHEIVVTDSANASCWHFTEKHMHSCFMFVLNMVGLLLASHAVKQRLSIYSGKKYQNNIKQYQNISKPYVCQILSGSKAQLRSLWYASFNSPLA